MPQQATPGRITTMERIVKKYKLGILTREQAIADVGSYAFDDVIPRFHNLASDKFLQGMFYEFDKGKAINLTDDMHSVTENNRIDVQRELDARWSLLEGEFKIKHNYDYALANDIRDTYLVSGERRENLTHNANFLKGYQGDVCFFCGEVLTDDVHVDHLLPRQVVNHDDLWNLVLGHELCNLQKSDKLVGEHFIDKLIKRNENIMGSNHPLRKKISEKIGNTPMKRASTLRSHYDNVRQVLGPSYWGGSSSYNPSTDPFYRKYITHINNRR
jgi:hypothetical protein